MRTPSACLAVLVLSLGCGPSVSPVVDVPAPAPAHDAPAPAPAHDAPAPVAPPPALVAAPPPPSVERGLPGFDGVHFGAPLPKFPYRDFESYNDGLVNLHCTTQFASFEGLPLADVDLFEGCCGGGVFRLHAYVDTSAPGSQDALTARIIARFGEGELYPVWDGQMARRIVHPAFELRVVPLPAKQQVKLLFTEPGVSRDLDDL